MTSHRTPTEAWRSRGLDVLGATLTCGLALAGFDRVFAGHSYLVDAFAGIVVAVIASVATARLPVLITVALGVVLFVWVGGVLAYGHETIGGIVPNAQGVHDIGIAAVHGWRDIVTTLPPIADANLLVIPLLCGCAGALIALQLAWRTSISALPLLGPAALVGAVTLLGPHVSAPEIGDGIAFTVTALAWAAFRHRRTQPVPTGGNRWPAGRIRAAGMLAVATTAIALVALTPVGAGATGYVLRDHVTPPFDVDAYPSPLSSFRRFEVTDKKTPLFTVTGLPADARIRLSVMDTYDGVVWGVAGGNGGTGASGVFRRVGDPIPTEPLPASVRAQTATIDVTVGALGGVWLPTVGETRSIDFAGPRASDLAGSFHFNQETGVGVVAARLHSGDRYRASVLVPSTPTITALRSSAFAEATMPDLTGVPGQVAAKAQAWTAGISDPVARLQAMAAQLRAGAFDDGTLNAGVPSLPGAGERRVATFLAAPQLVGDDEQYAATLGLLARDLGIPARVVLGVIQPPSASPSAPLIVTGQMVSAWVEVDVAGAGWVPVDPNPPVSNKPKPQPTPHQPSIVGHVVSPPILAAAATDEQPADNAGTKPPPPPPPVSKWLALLITISEYVGVPVVAVGGCAFFVLWRKRRRRKHRASGTPTDRVAGAWLELLDRMRDLGVAIPAHGTRRQRAAAMDYPQLTAFAARIDEGVFAPDAPSADSATAVWADVDSFLRRLVRTRTRTARLRAALDPRTLRPRRRRSAAVGTRLSARARLARVPLPRRPAHADTTIRTGTAS